MITVCLCDPEPVVQEGLRALLDQQGGFVLAESSSTINGAIDLAHRRSPHIVVLDRSYGMHALIEMIGALQRQRSDVRVVVWAASISDVECFRLLQAGAKGVVKKTAEPDSLYECLGAAANNQLWTEDLHHGGDDPLARPRNRPLTTRERQVAELVAKGMKNREIGESLGIATGTVKIHLMHIFEKTGIRDRFELALQGLRMATERADVGSRKAHAETENRVTRHG